MDIHEKLPGNDFCRVFLITKFFFMLIPIFLLPGCIKEPMAPKDIGFPGESNLSANEDSGSDSSGTFTPGISENPFIRFYQRHISPADGQRCSMHPSCSAYCSRVLKKHGWFMGWIMSCDRLMRCGRDEKHIAPEIIKNGRIYTYDPVERNDFWWYEP